MLLIIIYTRNDDGIKLRVDMLPVNLIIILIFQWCLLSHRITYKVRNSIFLQWLVFCDVVAVFNDKSTEAHDGKI